MPANRAAVFSHANQSRARRRRAGAPTCRIAGGLVQVWTTLERLACLTRPWLRCPQEEALRTAEDLQRRRDAASAALVLAAAREPLDVPTVKKLLAEAEAATAPQMILECVMCLP